MAQKKGGLGRGIGSLIPAGQKVTGTGKVAAPKAVAKTAAPKTTAKPATKAAPTSKFPAKPASSKPAGAVKAVAGKTPAKAMAKSSGSVAAKSVAKSVAAKPAVSAKPAAKASATPESQLLPVPGASFAYLDLVQIVPNPQQPRKTFEPEAFAELVHSVREIGVLQPIVVRPLPNRGGQAQYELIMGERRFRASKEAGLKSIPAVIRETANENMLRDALLENLHRADLNPLEEASAYQQLLEDFGITQEELADRIGRSRPQITNTIRLLKLPTSVQLKVAAGVLSAGHARAILGAAQNRRDYWANRVVNEGISVRTLEELLSMEKAPKEGGSSAAGKKPVAKLEILDELAAKLGDRISTRVNIKLNRDKGQIIIDFANFADLKRILAELEPNVE